MSASSARPILAAPPSGGEPSGSQNPRQPSQGSIRPKRTLIESACVACRKRKSKCDGQRPACSRCQTLRTECIYEAHEGESRWSALRRRKRDIEGERDDLRELVSFMQTRPEPEALEIFHRIRASGCDDLLRLIRYARENGHSLSGQNLVAQAGQSSTDQQRLPSINSMLSNLPPPSGSARGQTQMETDDHSEPRSARLPSMSSDGSGDSYLSTQSAGAVSAVGRRNEG